MATKKQEPNVESTQASTSLELSPKLKGIEKAGHDMLERVRAIRIASQGDYDMTGQLRVTIKTKLKELDEFVGPIKKTAHAAWQAVLSQEKKVAGPLETADDLLVKVRTKWTSEQEGIRRREEERLRLVEMERERERISQQAMELAKEDPEGALALLEEPTEIVSVKVEPFVEKQDGLNERTTWSAEVFDLRLLVLAVAQGLAPIEAIQADMKFLNTQAKAFRKAMSDRYPGVKAVPKTGEAVRL